MCLPVMGTIHPRELITDVATVISIDLQKRVPARRKLTMAVGSWQTCPFTREQGNFFVLGRH
jgi:hypothetical protein